MKRGVGHFFVSGRIYVMLELFSPQYPGGICCQTVDLVFLVSEDDGLISSLVIGSYRFSSSFINQFCKRKFSINTLISSTLS